VVDGGPEDDMRKGCMSSDPSNPHCQRRTVMMYSMDLIALNPSGLMKDSRLQPLSDASFPNVQDSGFLALAVYVFCHAPESDPNINPIRISVESTRLLCRQTCLDKDTRVIILRADQQ